MASSSDIPTGERATRFGEYVLLRRIAAGGMAEIHQGLLCGIGGFRRDVAIKRILPQFCSDNDFVSMLLDEARLVARIIHPNVAQVLNCGVEEGSYYIVMEYVEGQSLRALLRRTQKDELLLSVPECLYIAQCMLRALTAAHEQTDDLGEPMCIVHRDVTPENVLVSYRGEVKLVDFGVAKATGKLHKTRTGAVKGKLIYMAPEQIAGADIDHRTDQFATALVLYELLTGKVAYEKKSEGETVRAVFQCELPDVAAELTAARESLPSSLLDTLSRALSKDPEARFPSCRELEAELGHFLSASDLSSAARQLGERMQGWYAKELQGIRSSVSQMKASMANAEYDSGQVRTESFELSAEGSSPNATSSARTRVPSPDAATQVGAHAQAPAASRSGWWAAVVGAVVGLLLIAGGGAAVWLAVTSAGGLRPATTTPVAAQGNGVGRATGSGSEGSTVASKPGTGQDRGAAAGDAAPDATASQRSETDDRPAGNTSSRRTSVRGKTKTRSTSSRRSTRSTAKAVPDTSAPAESSQGRLNIACLPWCEIFLDGVKLDKSSPLKNHPISVGEHVVRVVNPPSGRDAVRHVLIVEGTREDLVFRLK